MQQERKKPKIRKKRPWTEKQIEETKPKIQWGLKKTKEAAHYNRWNETKI